MSYQYANNATRNVIEGDLGVMARSRKADEVEDEKTRLRRLDFGVFIRKHRDELRMTQLAAATSVGVSLRQWQRWESGESGVERDKIPVIAKNLKADLRETYERAGFTAPLSLREKHEFDESEFALYHSKVEKLTAQQKRDFYIFWEAAKNFVDNRERENREEFNK
jgi:transcriptional regulator with XRE-family HTH domain